ncbi:hypothetical protein Bca4012_095180 [Brassica carinata]
MHFMLEDVPRSLQEVFQSLKDFSEDSWKTLRNSRETLGRLRNSRKTLGKLFEKSSNVFYARRLSTKSSESLPKSYVQSGTKE